MKTFPWTTHFVIPSSPFNPGKSGGAISSAAPTAPVKLKNTNARARTKRIRFEMMRTAVRGAKPRAVKRIRAAALTPTEETSASPRAVGAHNPLSHQASSEANFQDRPCAAEPSPRLPRLQPTPDPRLAFPARTGANSAALGQF